MNHLRSGAAALVLAAACSGSIVPTAPGSDAGSMDGTHAGDAGSVAVDGGYPPDSRADSSHPADGSPGKEDAAVGGDAAIDAPCGEAEAGCATAEGFVLATMGPGPSSLATICPLGTTQSWLTVGAPEPSVPSVVQNGGTQNGEPVLVTCSVTPVNAGFDVSLQATTEGLSGGALTITSPPGFGAVTVAAGGQEITARWQIGTELPATETNCTIAFTYEGQRVPDFPPIAAGRIWGHLSCPQAMFSGQTVTGSDGGPTTVHCDGEADFLFEQCEQ